MREVVDPAVIAKAVAGHRTSFDMIFLAYYEHIREMAYRRVGRKGWAEDIAHNVYIKLGKTIWAFRKEAAFSTWLYKVVVSVTTDYVRKVVHFPVPEPEPEGGPDGEETIYQIQLRELLKRLTPQEFEAVILVYWEGHTHAEAAVLMGCAEGTVSKYLFEARARLRGLLEAQKTE